MSDALTVVRLRSPALKGHVRRPTGEPDTGVQGERGDVRLVDVQHRLVESTVAQVPQPGEGQRPAEPVAVRGRVHTEYVHLADRVVVMTGVAVHLGPVEPDHRTAL